MVSKVISGFLLLCIFTIIGATYLEYAGFIALRQHILDALESNLVLQRHVEIYRLGELGQETIDEKQNELNDVILNFTKMKKELTEKEEDLTRYEATLEQWENELKQEEIRIEERLNELIAVEDKALALERLAEMYSDMRDRDAARIMSDLSQELVASILVRMDTSDAARILGSMDSQEAAQITSFLEAQGQ